MLIVLLWEVFDPVDLYSLFSITIRVCVIQPYLQCLKSVMQSWLLQTDGRTDRQTNKEFRADQVSPSNLVTQIIMFGYYTHIGSTNIASKRSVYDYYSIIYIHSEDLA